MFGALDTSTQCCFAEEIHRVAVILEMAVCMIQETGTGALHALLLYVRIESTQIF